MRSVYEPYASNRSRASSSSLQRTSGDKIDAINNRGEMTGQEMMLPWFGVVVEGSPSPGMIATIQARRFGWSVSNEQSVTFNRGPASELPEFEAVPSSQEAI